MRTDERDGTFADVSCGRCGTVVGVRKSSAAQTSVQWRGESTAACSELAERRAAGLHPALVSRCESLTAAIDDAVRAGLVPVE